MAAIGTLPVLLGTGDHASRPAASAVGSGGLYSCTTHSLVYQTDGSSWTTWATLGGSGSVATDTIWNAAGDLAVGTGSDTAARLAIGSSGDVLTVAGGTASWAAPSGGGGATTPVFLQAPVRANGTNTIGAMSTGDRIIVGIVSFGGTVTGVACTNVTFTQVGTDVTSGSNKISVWVGVATGASGTSVTFTGSGTILNICAVVADTLTPTLDVQASAVTGGGFLAYDKIMSGVTVGALVVVVGMTDNTSSPLWPEMTAPHVKIPQSVSTQATCMAIGYAPDGDFTVAAISNASSSGGVYAVSIV